MQTHGFLLREAPVVASNSHVEEDLQLPEKPDSDEKKTFWSGKSSIPLDVTLMIAAIWVLTLGSAPILIYRWGEKKVTNSAIVVSCLSWAALFGGLYLFTNIIIFSSSHFDRERTLTVVECIYFMTQVITTVGYGDITPVFPRGRLFVGIYVTLSFFVIALLMSEMQSVVMQRVNKYKEKLQASGLAGSNWLDQLGGSDSLSRSHSNVGFKPEKPSPGDLIAAVALFVVIAFTWVMFFHFYPGENKPFLQACYMSLITLTTVGFGAVTPVTEGGMLFGAFFMFIGTSSLVNVVTAFSTFILEMDQWETWDAKKFENDLKKFGEKLPAGSDVPEEKFIAFALVQKGIVSQEQIDSIMETYAAMHADGTGGTEKSKKGDRVTRNILKSVGRSYTQSILNDDA